jgi:KUP system potassium uptake protein
VLGAVVLAVTGAEALFSDIGHCGRNPIRVAWFAFVLPCLLLHYFGQGALVLRAPEFIGNPFYHLAPRWALLPLVGLATVATSIASQAVLTGAFSLTRQLMHLGYSPLVTVHHTSDEQEGQVYVPQINLLLFVGCVVLILTFRSSHRLEAAYGLAVTGTMAASSLLFFAVTRTIWRWPLPLSLLLLAFFWSMDLAFLAANIPKIPHGGWVPLAIAIVAMLFCTTWRRGRQQLLQERDVDEAPLDALWAELDRLRPCRVPGTAVFLTLNPDEAPSVLGRHLDSIPALHEQVVLLAFGPAGVDRVAESRRIAITRLEHGFVRVIARYGFRQRVDVADTLAECERRGLRIDLEKTTFYVSRERIIPNGKMRMATWRKRLFAYLHRNSPSTQDFVGLPADRVVELGAQVVL